MNDSDPGAAIVALRMAGADRFDPVRLHYLQVLAQRANTHQGPVKRVLEEKLAQALVAFRARFEQARRDAENTVAGVAPQHPQAGADLQRLLHAGDFTGVRRRIATLQESGAHASLGGLVRYLAQHAQPHAEGGLDGRAEWRSELKTMRYFRNTWSKLSVDKQVTKALEQPPRNAGPINSHMLVLRSLARMRDISPDYLNRFMSYADTLLCLDQGEREKQAGARRAAEAENGKRAKSRRGRSL